VLSADTSTTPEGDINSVTAWSAEGAFIWSDDSLPAVSNLAAKRFGNTDFAFALSQQGKLIAIYDVSTPTALQLVQKIAIEAAPTGIALMPARGLAAISDDSGEILLYRRTRSAESTK